MKTILKNTCPKSLAQYAKLFPDATWDDIRNNDIYTEVRQHLIQDQKNLCAYCECRLIESTPHAIRVEHFHPKSDTSSVHNWHIDWQNLLAACTGGEREGDAFPLPSNLSCDACKKNEIHDGDILNPLRLPPFPAAFIYNRRTGELVPNTEFCSAHPSLPDNTLSTTYELLSNTLNVLNLNCYRLCQERLKVFWFLEHQKKSFRDRNIPESVALRQLAQRYFSMQWPAFFTVLRCCLHPYADEFLHSLRYNG